jgi:hypothetical protein
MPNQPCPKCVQPARKDTLGATSTGRSVVEDLDEAPGSASQAEGRALSERRAHLQGARTGWSPHAANRQVTCGLRTVMRVRKRAGASVVGCIQLRRERPLLLSGAARSPWLLDGSEAVSLCGHLWGHSRRKTMFSVVTTDRNH